MPDTDSSNIYLEQLNRIVRLQKQCKQYLVPDDEHFSEGVDCFINFFIQCYHLRDWLINSGFLQKNVDNHIKNSAYLNLSKDFANNQKHQKITRYKPKNTFVAHNFGLTTPISIAYDPFKQEKIFNLAIWEFGYQMNVHEAVNGCVEDWKKFLALHKN